MRNTRSKQRVGTFIKYMFMGFVVLISCFPLVWVFLSSFKTNPEIMGSALSFPSSFNLKSYEMAFKLSPIHLFFSNSIIVTVMSTLLNVFIVGMAAYVIARNEFKYKYVIVIMLSAALLIPQQALSYPIINMMKSVGLMNTKTGLIILYAAWQIPITLFILRSYFLSIPREIEEAAQIDGLGFFGNFFRVVLPIAKPGLATAAIMQFLFAWNEFYFALILTTGKESRTLPLALSYFTSSFAFDYSAMFAAIMLTILPSIIVFFILQEQVVKGLTDGAVKG